MVYLTRTLLLRESKWREAFDFAIKARDHIRKDSLVVQSDVLTGINGKLNRLHFVTVFKSLADEEKWAEKSMADPEYMALLEGTIGNAVENSSEDNLYRSQP
jgi:hypothetical protein